MSIYTGPIFILDTTTYSPNSTYSTGATTGFPLSNIADRTHPFRTYRSSVDPTSTAIELVYDLGASPPKVNAIFIDNTNLATWKIQHSTGITGSYSDWLAATTSQLDRLTGRVKVFLDTSSLSQNERYLKLVATTQTPLLAPLTAGMVGGVTIGTEANTIDLPGGGINNIDITQILPTIQTKFAGGAKETTEIGSKFVEINIPSEQYLRDSQEEEFTDILNMGTAPFVFFENGEDLSRAYLVTHSENSTKLTYNMRKVLNAPLAFTEVV